MGGFGPAAIELNNAKIFTALQCFYVAESHVKPAKIELWNVIRLRSAPLATGLRTLYENDRFLAGNVRYQLADDIAAGLFEIAGFAEANKATARSFLVGQCQAGVWALSW